MERIFAARNNIQAEDNVGVGLIRQDTFACDSVYDESISFSELYSHRFVEVSVVVSGSGIHRVLGQAIPCRVGDIYILNSGIPHRYFLADVDEGLTVRRLLFDPKDWFDGEVAQPSSARFCYGIFSENAATAYAMLTKRVLDRILSLYDATAIEQIEKKDGWRDAVRANISLIMITLGRYVNSAIKSIPAADASEWGYVSAVLAMVKDNLGDTSMTLESIADSFYVSKSKLSRLFSRLTGEAFSDYLKRARLSAACSMLIDTDMTVEQIMIGCGMRDAGSFYKAFGKYTGMTPNQYRKLNKKGENIMNIISEILENLQKGKAKAVKELVQQALDEGISAETILNDGLLAGMSIVGEKFKNNEVYVPEVLVAARAMNMGAGLLKPYLAESGVTAKGKVCIGTVAGDLHDIGKNLVKMMLEGKGLEVIDLGTDVPAETFVKTAIDENCQVICCSALLTTTMGVMEEVVKAAEAAGIRDKVKIMVGGAPVSEDFCKNIGADCYTVDAASAADAAVAFCKG